MNVSEARILFITRQMSRGGTEKVILSLCQIFMPLAKNIVVCSAGGAQTNALAGMGIRHYSIPDFSDKKFGAVFSTIRIICMVIRKEHISVIHAHTRRAALYARICGGLFHIPVVATAHSVFGDKKRLTRFAYHTIRVVACGKGVLNNLLDFYGLRKNQVWLINNGVKEHTDGKILVPEIQRCKEDGGFAIAICGRLCKEKAVDVAIKAMSDAKVRAKNIQLFIVGDGEERTNLQNMVCHLNVQTTVHFFGYRSDVPNIMQQVDLCVQTSVIEGLPLVLIEAQAAALPVVATAIPGTTDVIVDEYNGKLVPVNDEKKLAEAILFMASNSDIRKLYAQNARACYEAHFSYQSFAGKYIQFYEEI